MPLKCSALTKIKRGFAPFTILEVYLIYMFRNSSIHKVDFISYLFENTFYFRDR